MLCNDDARIHAGDSLYRRTHDFIGLVLDVDADGVALVEGRNRFFPGESIELIGPKMRTQAFVVGTPKNDDGEALTVVQPNARVRMSLPYQACPGDMLRRETETKKEV